MARYFSKIMILIVILFCAAHLTGCFAVTQSPALGVLYTDAAAPITATSTAPSDKMLKGTATVTSYFGLVATGDASIAAAAKSAGITKIHIVDYHSKNILGIVAEYTVIVYGE